MEPKEMAELTKQLEPLVRKIVFGHGLDVATGFAEWQDRVNKASSQNQKDFMWGVLYGYNRGHSAGQDDNRPG